MKNNCLMLYGKKFLLGIAVFCMLTGITGCSQKEEKEPEQSPSATNEAAVDYNEDETSNLGLWARAMGSVLIYLNDGNPYYFGGYQITEDNTAAAGNILSGSWNINNRLDLLKQINTLLKTGDRMNYRKEVKEMNAMSKKQLKRAMKQLSGDLLIHYQMVQYNNENWQENGLLAWDMCRVSHLVQWGYVAGYLNREEAQALIEPAAAKLKQHFKNWEEVQNNWMDGFCLFANVDREAANTDYTNRKALYQKLLDAQDKNHPLYDDNLFTEEIIPVSGITYQTILEELEEEEKASDTQNKKNSDKKTKSSEKGLKFH